MSKTLLVLALLFASGCIGSYEQCERECGKLGVYSYNPHPIFGNCYCRPGNCK